MWHALLAMAFSSMVQGAYTEENSMKVLNDNNFHDFIHTNPRAMVFFYTPGCGPWYINLFNQSENFLPQVEKAAFLLAEEGIPFGKLEAEGNKDSAKMYSVNGYPTLLWFEDARNKTKYDGGRTYDAVQMWVYERINPGSSEAKDIQDVRSEIEESDCVFFFFGDDSKDRTFRRYRDFSFTIGTAKFRHTFAKGAAKELGLPEKTQIAVFKKFDKSPVVFTPKQLKVPELKAFTELNMLPRITQWTSEIENRIFKKDRNAIVLFSSGQPSAEHEAFKEFAYQFPAEEYIIIISASPDSTHWTHLQRQFGVWDSLLVDGPKLLFLAKNGTQKYLFTGDFTAKRIESFVYDSRDGKVARYYKSQESPSRYEGIVGFEYLTGNTYLSKMQESPLDWVVVYIDARDNAYYEWVAVKDDL